MVWIFFDKKLLGTERNGIIMNPNQSELCL